MMLAELYKDALARVPDKAAVIGESRSLTYRQLDEIARQYAATLAELGVGPGDRVAFFMRNRLELIELYLACFILGAVAVPLNNRFQTDEVIYACNLSTPRLMIVDAERLPKVSQVRRQLCPSWSASLFWIIMRGATSLPGPRPSKRPLPWLTSRFPTIPIIPRY